MSDETTTSVEAPTVADAPPVEPLADGVAVDTPPEAATPDAEPVDAPEAAKPTADAWATLRRQEDRNRRASEEHRATVKASEDRSAELDKRAAELEERAKHLGLDAFDGDPSRFLEHHGIDYDDLTRRMLDRPQERKASSDIETLRAEIAELRTAREAEKTQRDERGEEQRWQGVVDVFATEIAPPAEGEHAYELLHHEYAANADFVTSTLREMAVAQPDLTVAQAAARFEDYLMKQTQARLGLSKVRALFPSDGEPKPSITPQAEQGTATSTTAGSLSHQDSSERAADPRPSKERHEMTLKEQREWDAASMNRAESALSWGSSA